MVTLLETQWLTVEEVSERLRVTPWTVRNWLTSGQLRGLRLGVRAGWRVAPKELERFIEERMR